MARRHRWRFVWDEESTRRGLLRVLTAVSALVAVRHSPEMGALVLAVGQLIIGLLGMFRSDA